MSDPSAVGVVGAGTMGAGIAQVACTAGFETHLHDPVEAALERGVEQIVEAHRALRGPGAHDARRRPTRRSRGCIRTRSCDALGPCELVIEAAPEDLELKRKLFAELSEVCGPDTVLATNTSSLPVTALATAAHPGPRTWSACTSSTRRP